MHNSLNVEEKKIDIHSTTYEYYSKFICYNLLNKKNQDIVYVETNERDKIMKGFGCKFSIYAFISNEQIIIAYSPKFHNIFIKLKEIINQDNIVMILKSYFPTIISKKIFEYTENKDIDSDNVQTLNEFNYNDFEQFFLKLHSNIDLNDNWLKEYFLTKAQKGLMFGYYVNNKLVCVVDAPDMPYDENKIQHTGVATLSDYRRKGYAKKTASFAAKKLIEKGIVPQWETIENNFASINLAKSIGYHELATAMILEED